ncbi:hypothetical protein BIW11_03247 [Tropilaelaps mercedesae]|uniref:Uncharacterized protein n=1 Tax=Tropilaelaps mercedesae TaxID=418985 RepID=A0A1V9XQ94_9ACAR|nr:hypothetical protein BIW11_03247 [Tropilaelaps mercedesae]
MLLLLIYSLSDPPRVDAQTKVTLLDCITQELPATVSPRFRECVQEAQTSGTIYRFITGFECILRLANAIRPDRSVDLATLFAAVGDFKGTRFEKAALDCQTPLPAIKFTICMLERFQEICKDRVKIPRPPDKTGERPYITAVGPSRRVKPQRGTVPTPNKRPRK